MYTITIYLLVIIMTRFTGMLLQSQRIIGTSSTQECNEKTYRKYPIAADFENLLIGDKLVTNFLRIS